jgi:glucose-1-phosphate thymidylyltransferase
LLSAFPKNNFVFVIQKKPIGLANAVYQAKKFVNGSTFLLMFPDHFQLDTKLLSYFVNSKYPLILAQKENEKNSLKYGVIFLNKNKTISKIIEKPKFLPKGFYLCSQCYYLLPNSIFDAIKNIKTEYLQDAINLTIKDGEKYFVYDKKYKSYDMGTLKGLEKTQREIKKI